MPDKEIFVVDFWRQMDLLNPTDFEEKINVIGVGATGSYVTYLLAKMGLRNLHVWDFDVVEPHNLPNQIFGLRDIGKPKVEALKALIKDQTDIDITIHNEPFIDQKLEGIVFLLVDNMDVRKQIWENSIKMKITVKLMIETRAAIDNGRIYTINPLDLDAVKLWEGSLYTSEEAEEVACTNRAIAPTISFLASIATWKVIKYLNKEDYCKELILACRPSIIIST